MVLAPHDARRRLARRSSLNPSPTSPPHPPGLSLFLPAARLYLLPHLRTAPPFGYARLEKSACGASARAARFFLFLSALRLAVQQPFVGDCASLRLPACLAVCVSPALQRPPTCQKRRSTFGWREGKKNCAVASLLLMMIFESRKCGGGVDSGAALRGLRSCRAWSLIWVGIAWKISAMRARAACAAIAISLSPPLFL